MVDLVMQAVDMELTNYIADRTVAIPSKCLDYGSIKMHGSSN
jgi:hypothetical protein